MRYAKGHKEEVRSAILENASRRFRADGIGAVGIKTMMGDAGLTHGGFYAHFSSREAVVSEASEEALRRTYDFLRRLSAKGPPSERLKAFVNGYLSQQHLDDMAGGCAGAALAPEIARQSDDARRRFSAGLRLIVDYLADLLPEGGSESERSARAHAIFAMMMGSMQMARVAIESGVAKLMLEGARTNALQLAAAGWPGQSEV